MKQMPMSNDPAMIASDVARKLAMREGEVAVLGLGRSGFAVAKLLHAAGMKLYASDSGNTPLLAANASELREMGIAVQLGGHDEKRISNASILVVSPGIPPQVAALVAAREASVPIVSEVEIALRMAPGMRVIATTGTNGKTTTTSLIGHLLRELGHNAADIGNIGIPVSEVVLRKPQPDWGALEMSSFQLHDTPGFHPWVGVLTTLSPDHLDRYYSVSSYYDDKRKLFANAHHGSRWVINGDSDLVVDMVRAVPGRVFRYSVTDATADAYLDSESQMLTVFGSKVVHRDQLKLQGVHNLSNTLAALLAVTVADASHNTEGARKLLAAGVAKFSPLPHRLEPVSNRNGVLWLNDSKATNVASTLVALQGMRQPTVLLLGGRHKGEPYTVLSQAIADTCKAVIAYGEAAHEIEKDLTGQLPDSVSLVVMPNSSFGDVINVAQQKAQQGDAILLSPACSSYDMFDNYEQRGAAFAALARGAA